MDEDLVLEDDSVASSVPTDLSISEISDLKVDLRSANSKGHSGGKGLGKRQVQKEKDKLAKLLLERKQAEHDVQLLKIDLKQKDYLLDNVKTEHQMKIDDLEDKIAEYKHQRKLLQAKYDGQMNVVQEESRRSQEKLVQELMVMKKKLGHLEQTNRSLADKAADIKQKLRDYSDIDEEKYYDIRSQSDESLGVKDLVAMKIFECLRPYKVELDEVKSRLVRLTETHSATESQAQKWREELDQEKKENATHQVKIARLSAQVQDLSVKAENKDFRIDNYDRINREREELEKELVTVRERMITIESEYSTVEHDKKHYEAEYKATKSAHTLLQQDKDYLSRQVSDLSSKLSYTEDRLQRQTAELDEVKRAREQLFEKYVTSRDVFKSQYEQQLQAELKHMSTSTQEEVEKLRATTKSMYEMEARTLRETRDIAMAERDRALANDSDMTAKYHSLNDEYRQERSNLEAKFSQLSNDIKMAEYEKHRAQLIQEETAKNCKDFQVDNEKLLKKLEIATNEHHTLQRKTSQQVMELENQVKEQQTRLQAYENIERELDEVILQAAEIDDEEGSEKALFSYGYGATLPSSSQRRMKQSVHLARRCLALERKSVGDKREMDEMRAKLHEIVEECEKLRSKLNQAEQPYSYLVNKTSEMESQVKSLKQSNYTLENDLKSLQKRYKQAVSDNKRLVSDLEHTCRQGDEISMMKESLREIVHSAETKTKPRQTVMHEYQNLEKVRGLVENGGQASLEEAVRILDTTRIRENVASRVLDGTMDQLEAITYLNSYLRKHGKRIAQSLGKRVGSKFSDPTGVKVSDPSDRTTAPRQSYTTHDTSLIHMERQKRPPFRVGSPNKRPL